MKKAKLKSTAKVPAISKSKAKVKSATAKKPAKPAATKKAAAKAPAVPTKPKKIAVKAGASKKALTKKDDQSFTTRLKHSVESITEQIGDVFASNPDDIVDALKLDHKALRNFLGVLKDTDKDMAERRRAYALFSSLLKSHSASEEKAVYTETMTVPDKDMHIRVAESFVEHAVADELMKRMERATEPLEWSAHANVLAEAVEHHLKEEERILLPKIRKNVLPEARQKMLSTFISLRQTSQDRVGPKNAGVLDAAEKMTASN